MGAVSHAHQDRADFKAIGLGLDRIAHRTGNFGICENQNIGSALKACIGEDALAQFRVEGCVDLHFTFVDEIAVGPVENAHRLAHTPRRCTVEIAELGIGAQGDFRLNAEAPDMTRRGADDLGDFGSRSLREDLGIGDEQRA